MTFNIASSWRGGFANMTRREDHVRYSGQTRSIGTNENISVPFSPTCPMPRCAPVLKHAPNPFVVDGECINTTIDFSRVVQPDSTQVAHGRGTLTWFDAVLYSGQFSDGWKDGQGQGLIFVPQTTCTEKVYASSRPVYSGVYEGVWRYGARHGFGTMCFVDGTVYRGCWIDDAPNGVGQLTYADGSVLTGTFAGDIGKPVGACVLRGADGANEIHFFQSPGKLATVRNTANVAAAEKTLLEKLKALEAGAQPFVPCMGARAIPAIAVGSAGASVGGAAGAAAAPAGAAGAAAGGAAAAAGARAPMMMMAPAPASAAEPPTLMKKRVLKEWIAKDAVEFEQRVYDETGVQVALRVHSESFTEHAAAGGTAINALVDPVTVCHPLLAALKQVAGDDMGKESIAGSLEAFQVVNSDAARAAEFAYDAGKKVIIIKLPFTRGVGCKGLLTQDAVAAFLLKNI